MKDIEIIRAFLQSDKTFSAGKKLIARGPVLYHTIGRTDSSVFKVPIAIKEKCSNNMDILLMSPDAMTYGDDIGVFQNIREENKNLGEPYVTLTVASIEISKREQYIEKKIINLIMHSSPEEMKKIDENMLIFYEEALNSEPISIHEISEEIHRNIHDDDVNFPQAVTNRMSVNDREKVIEESINAAKRLGIQMKDTDNEINDEIPEDFSNTKHKPYFETEDERAKRIQEEDELNQMQADIEDVRTSLKM